MPVVHFSQPILVLLRRRWRALLAIACIVAIIFVAFAYSKPIQLRTSEAQALLSKWQEFQQPAQEYLRVQERRVKHGSGDVVDDGDKRPLSDKLKRSGVIYGNVAESKQERDSHAGVPDMDRGVVEAHQQWQQTIQNQQSQMSQWNMQPPQQEQHQQLHRPAIPYIPPKRVVHFDLKGAPPTVQYFTKIFPLIKKLGATDILMEWEDMFPFHGALQPAAAKNHFSRNDIRKILEEAKRNSLKVIPLVQTFGHLELFLKLEPFAPLREIPEQPAALCPSRNESLRLVEAIIDQVMEFHGDAEVLHVGCDEVYHMGLCDLCRQVNREELFLRHVKHVASYVHKKYKIKSLIWDDMMRHMSTVDIQGAGIGELVEPMVWVYAEDIDRFAGPHIYDTFSAVFPRIWAASAYKGAFGETLVAPPLKRHVDNNVNWLRVMQREAPRFRDGFAGLVITGWQRYDHFAVLCELLPAAIPSLAITLSVATYGVFNNSVVVPVNKALRCSSYDDQSGANILTLGDDDPEGFYQFGYCRFPGSEFFKFLGRFKSTLYQLDEFFTTATKSKGWLTDYNVERNYTNPFRVDELLEMFNGNRHLLTQSMRSVKSSLKDIVDRFTVAEWVEQKIYPYIKKMDKLIAQGEALKRRNVWENRPLPMLPELAQYGFVDVKPTSEDAAASDPHPAQSHNQQVGQVLPVTSGRKRMHVPTNGHGGGVAHDTGGNGHPVT